ncbi:MAG: hypothetical protein J5766_03125, partial [Clostridia bacterium]|nr:hypothetical protein [Clostridia bacterium]
MFAKRTVSVLLAVVLCIACFSGCKNKADVKYEYNGNVKIKTLDSCVLAENDNLRLSWNNDKKGIALLVKSTGKVWKNYRDAEDLKSTGDGTANDAKGDSQYVSTLDVYYQSQNTFLWDLASSNSENMRNKRISAEKVKNGIKLTYYFDKIKISVPVTYVLRKDSLSMSLDGREIGEDGTENRLISVVPSRYLMTVDMKEPDAYIFVSDGIGALVDTQYHASGTKKDFSVGGGNAALLSTSSDSDPSDSAGMRAYGIKVKDEALFCIAEQNPASLLMRVNAGDISSDSSKIYGDIFVTDSDYTMGKASNAGEVRILSDRMQSVISVGFYPLSGEDANYVGMAKCYQNYLKKNGYISNQKRDFSSPYAVTALGGVMVTESILGVPKRSLKVATTFNEAKDLFSSFSKDIGEKPVTRIKGFGESGLNPGKVGGGFNFASSFGSDGDFSNLQESCKNMGKTLYTD